MNIVASGHFISALHDVLHRPEPGPPGPGAERITRRALADGWITAFEIESLLIETDVRLWQVTTREMLRVFGIETQPVFERPTRGARDAEGLPRVSAVDLARLLVMLERSGLSVDPLPLCQALAPSLGAKRLLTSAELIVFWRAQRRCDDDVLTFHTDRTDIECGPITWTTRAGYEVRGFYGDDPDGDFDKHPPQHVEMLTILPPAGSKRRAAKVRSAASRTHLRKYLGEPRAGKSPRRPSPRPAA